MTSSNAIQFENVSLILMIDDTSTHQERLDHRIWQAVSALGLIRFRTEIILVTGQNFTPDSEQTRQLYNSVTYRPYPKMFPCLKQAIEAAKHPLIAITDPDVEIDTDVWKLLKQRSSRLSIQTAYHSSVSGAKPSNRFQTLKRFQVTISEWLSNALLRTKKSELRHGLTMLTRTPRSSMPHVHQLPTEHNQDASSQPDPLAPLWTSSPTQQNLASSTQLLALARLNGTVVNEIDLGIGSSSNAASAPSSKTIRRSVAGSVRFWWNTMMFPRHRFELQQQLEQSEPTKPNRIGWAKQLATISTLAMLAVFCLFHWLGFALFEPDEARNAQLALNVIESGDWLSLKLNREFYWDKPPFQIWAIAASYQTFGVNQWSTRLPGAIASLLTILMTVLIGKRLVGFRAAAIGTFMLLITAGFLFTGRYVTMDAALTASTTATLLLGFLAIRDRFNKATAVAAGIACGIGVLTKGPIAIVICLPPLIVANWLLAKQRPQESKTRNRWLWLIVPTFVVSAPWFIATSLVHPDFLTYFFWKHHFVRFSSAFNHREPFWYYALGIFLFMFPASYLLPSTARFLTSRRPENRMWRTREHGFLFLSVVWIIGFFTLAESKLPTYIVPSFPLICLLMGVLVERRILQRGQLIPGQAVAVSDPDAKSPYAESQRSFFDGLPGFKSRRSFFDGLTGRAPLELVFWISVGSVALLTMLPSASASLAWMIVSAAIIGTLGFLAVRRRSKPKLAWVCFGLLALFTVDLIVHRIVPAAAEQRSIHSAARQLRNTAGFADAPLVFFGREPYGSTLVHDPDDVKFFQVTQTSKLVEFLSANPTAIIVASDDPMKTLRDDLPWTIRLDQHEEARHLYTSQINTAVARSVESEPMR